MGTDSNGALQISDSIDYGVIVPEVWRSVSCLTQLTVRFV